MTAVRRYTGVTYAADVLGYLSASVAKGSATHFGFAFIVRLVHTTIILKGLSSAQSLSWRDIDCYAS